ncbi:hypothetical protein CBM2587_B20014 [Cupriavidus taiwanensis]|uniref:Uncharacterized protein n=1 Tax=Cupriavidus taiwanensis TaxID=164546 RepID=A0A375C1L0_9BURK|nr:hypothetical protein CBM2587_B20014 [Cupriavidus taiwanensis]
MDGGTQLAGRGGGGGRGEPVDGFDCGVALGPDSLLVCSPLPLAGEGPGVRAGRRYAAALCFVDALALTPTLSRKREREYPSGIWKACGISLYLMISQAALAAAGIHTSLSAIAHRTR